MFIFLLSHVELVPYLIDLDGVLNTSFLLLLAGMDFFTRQLLQAALFPPVYPRVPLLSAPRLHISPGQIIIRPGLQ